MPNLFSWICSHAFIIFFSLIAFNQTAKLTTATIKIIHVALRNVTNKKKEGENCRVTHGRLGELSEDPTSPAPTESTEYARRRCEAPPEPPLESLELPTAPRCPKMAERVLRRAAAAGSNY